MPSTKHAALRRRWPSAAYIEGLMSLLRQIVLETQLQIDITKSRPLESPNCVLPLHSRPPNQDHWNPPTRDHCIRDTEIETSKSRPPNWDHWNPWTIGNPQFRTTGIPEREKRLRQTIEETQPTSHGPRKRLRQTAAANGFGNRLRQPNGNCCGKRLRKTAAETAAANGYGCGKRLRNGYDCDKRVACWLACSLLVALC